MGLELRSRATVALNERHQYLHKVFPRRCPYVIRATPSAMQSNQTSLCAHVPQNSTLDAPNPNS